MDAQASNEALGPHGSGKQPATLPAELANHPDYEIVRALSAGGMGLVFLARNRLLGRHEVLKIIGPDLIENPGMRDRFRREIRAVARLRHPNIVTAYSAFRAGESLVFAMEYAEGLDLARMVAAKGPMPVGHACAFIHQAALGLQHAHQAGLVHRDIKPGNLMLTRKGGRAIIKILDFGLAKAGREQGTLDLTGTARSSREPSAARGLTLAGQTLGTPEFIAPEQIGDAQAADIRADIYSLGCTLYYLLSSRPPFEAGSLADVLQAHYSMDATPLDLVRPDLPAELAALVTKMMAKAPAHRFQTPEEVARALAPFFKKRSMGHSGPGLAAASAIVPEATGRATAPAEAAAATGAGAWSDLIELDQTEDDGEAVSADSKQSPARGILTPVAYAGIGALAAVLVVVVVAIGINGRETTWLSRTRPATHGPPATEGTRAKLAPALPEPKPGTPIASAALDADRRTHPNPAPDSPPSRTAALKRGNVPIADSSRTKSAPAAATTPSPPAPRVAPELPEIATFKATDRAIQARMLPDERHLLFETGGKDRALWLGDLEDPRNPRLIDGNPPGWLHLALSSDGRFAALACEDNTVRSWDLRTGRTRLILEETAGLTALALSPDDRRAAYVSGEALHICDVITGSSKKLRTQTAGGISQVAFRPDGRRLISIGDDNNIRAWDVDTGREVEHMRSPPRVTGLAVFPDGNRVMMSFSGPKIAVWDLGAGHERRQISFLGACIAISPDGRRALLGGENRMRLWDLETDEELKRVDHESELLDVAFSPDGRRAISCTDGAVRVWGLPPGRPHDEQPAAVEVAQFLGHEGIVHSVVISRDGRRVLTGGSPDTMRLWNLDTRELIRSFGSNSGAIQSLAFSPRGDQALSGGDDGRVRLWNLESGEQVREFRGHEDSVFIVAVSPDGRRAYSAGGGILRDGWKDGTDFAIRSWDLRNGDQLQPFEGHKGYVTSVAVSPDGGRLLSGGNDATVILWDTKTRAEIHRMQGQKGRVDCVAFLPDGRRAVSCGLDTMLHMWDLESGRELPAHFKVRTGWNNWLASSPDGHRLFSSDGGGRELRLWDVQNGKLMQSLSFGGVAPTRGAFTPDGRHAIWGGWDGVVRMYRVQKAPATTRAAAAAKPGPD
jgi:WD40 repeat protein